MAKRCLAEDQWGSLTFEDSFNPVTGKSEPRNVVGTTSSRYYDTNRTDSVTRTVKNYSVPE